VRTAALLLVSSAMLRNLSFGSELNACAIAASSPEYGFCSDLMPSVEEKVSVSNAGLRKRCSTRFVAHMSIHKYGLSYRIETTAIDAYVEHLNDRQQ